MNIHSLHKKAITLITLIPAILIFSVLLSACAHHPSPTTSSQINQTLPVAHQWSEPEINRLKRFSIQSLPEFPLNKSNAIAKSPIAVELGHQLFFDKRLSKNGKVSCASCHEPDKYFTDGRKTGKGVAIGNRNTPTIVGISHSNWFFLDGRTDSLWAQAMGPMENNLEHGGNRALFAHVIYRDPELRKLYESIFGAMPNLADRSRFPENAAPIDQQPLKTAWFSMEIEDQNSITQIFVNISKSIAAYESLIQPGESRFDQYIEALDKRDSSKISTLFSEQEAKGMRLFMGKAQCAICHNGPLFSDFGFHNVVAPPTNTKNYDWGRYPGVNNVLKSRYNCYSEYNDNPDKTCAELDFIVKEKAHTVGAFKTPILRNAIKTAPYMHAGQFQSLTDVVKHYSAPPKTKIGQSDLLPIKLNNVEQKQLVAFLKTLESDINADPKYLKPPEK